MDALLKNTFSKISPAYELVADVTIATATTQVDFSGLNFGKDDDLMLVVDYKSAAAVPRLFINDNITETNYYVQRLEADNTGIAAIRYNTSLLAAISSNKRNQIFAKLKLSNSGYFIYQIDQTRNYADSLMVLGNLYGTSTFTSSSITKINIVGSVANGIEVGCRFRLYRLKAKKVFDINLFSEMDYIDITGLDIDKGSEYMLVGELNNPTASIPGFRLYANENYTDTNYWTQALEANGTTVTGARSNIASCLFAQANSKTFISLKIKLTNSGHFVFQLEGIINNGTSNMYLAKRYTTSTFTMSSITSLRFLTNITNTVGSGSRLTLYKMK